MNKRQLEILIQKLNGKPSYNNALEQYDTDPSVVSEIAFTAFLQGNVEGKDVIDLGTGNGAFAYAAAMLGAKRVLAVDIDPESIAVAKANCEGLGIEFQASDVRGVTGAFDTCFMNPPWGSVIRDADIPFIEVALMTSKVIYSIHNEKGSDYVRQLLSARGNILAEKHISLKSKRRYPHHRKEMERISAVLFITASGND